VPVQRVPLPTLLPPWVGRTQTGGSCERAGRARPLGQHMLPSSSTPRPVRSDGTPPARHAPLHWDPGRAPLPADPPQQRMALTYRPRAAGSPGRAAVRFSAQGSGYYTGLGKIGGSPALPLAGGRPPMFQRYRVAREREQQPRNPGPPRSRSGARRRCGSPGSSRTHRSCARSKSESIRTPRSGGQRSQRSSSCICSSL
jgi:hypothetical protein